MSVSKPVKVLNLYAGVGGNRKKWKNVVVTAVEKNPEIAAVYKKLNPLDEIVIGDARGYLLRNYKLFDFVWSSPPCQKNSRMVKASRHAVSGFPDLSLYEEVIFLDHFFKGRYVVENVIPYYKPILNPSIIDRHCFWANFYIPPLQVKKPVSFTEATGPNGRQALMDWLGIHFEEKIYYNGNNSLEQVLRNCCHPDIGEHVFRAAYSGQTKLF